MNLPAIFGFLFIQFSFLIRRWLFIVSITIVFNSTPFVILSFSIFFIGRVFSASYCWIFGVDFCLPFFAVARYGPIVFWSMFHFVVLLCDVPAFGIGFGISFSAIIVFRFFDGPPPVLFICMVRWSKNLYVYWAFHFGVFDDWVVFMMCVVVTVHIFAFLLILCYLFFAFFYGGSFKMQ
ncbi:hypothetical protein [Salegentibacter holothuriorum]|uniref:hypothetical protein n=1 Tax=Salegentibacter holothuriorum TaxID=241145 RepID=UPI0011177852|nr:hypothetical protein [Salegentibacter holothuriorum]